MPARRFPAVFWCLAILVLPAAAQRLDRAKSLAPYVPSPQVIVEKMLRAADLKPGETLYDLGCGDGRVLITAAQKFGAKAVGVELSAELAAAATERVRELGLQRRVRVIHGDLMEADLSGADVVTIYLLTLSNERLKPNLEKYLRKGARVVSHDFQVRGWNPARVEKAEMYHRTHFIYVYEMSGRK
jgi:ubiquinone/menaquinone biosynthesis C-methylase UbiE